jgi:hypothetical protein
MILHLSQLAGFLVWGLGFVAPILIWQLKKEQIPELDAHGKVVTNWIISAVVYSAVCGLFFFLVVPLFLLILLALAGIVFAIVGGIKASNGEVWPYPGSIKFFK